MEPPFGRLYGLGWNLFTNFLSQEEGNYFLTELFLDIQSDCKTPNIHYVRYALGPPNAAD